MTILRPLVSTSGLSVVAVIAVAVLAVSLSPVLGMALAAAVLGATILVWLGGARSRVVSFSVAVILAGYALGGRGFAYIGYPPFFIGEIVMVFGAATLVLSSLRLPRAPVVVLLWLYMGVGAARIVPDLPEYGAMALRDAVIWGYGVFAIVVAALVIRWGDAGWRRIIETYGRYLPVVLGLMVGVMILGRFATVPSHPFVDVPLVMVKTGDAVSHAAAAASFLLLGLSATQGARRDGSWIYHVASWSFIGITVILGTANRGGLMAFLTAIAVLAVTRRLSLARSVTVLACAIFVVVTVVAFDIRFPISSKLTIGASDIVVALASVFDDEVKGETARSGTRQWRLNWWSDIIDYTVFGPYFFTGKGFGINLANADGYQVYADESLRSPYNAHMTVLARGGVPAAVLWIALQLSFALALLVYARRAERRGDSLAARVMIWCLAMWTAFMVNGAFDVFLEGPQGGIWFWSVFGFGLAMMHLEQHRLKPGSEPLPPRRAS